MQNNRLTFMERLSERLTSVEAILKKLDPIESLLERIALLEKNIYTTKRCLPSKRLVCISEYPRVCCTS